MFRAGVALVARRPQLALAWLAALLVPAIIATIPLDFALAPALDFRPAAAHLVTPPANDALWHALERLRPSLPPLATGSALITAMIAIPLLWIIAGFVTLAERDDRRSAAEVTTRSIAIAVFGVPLRVLVAAATAMLVWRAQTTIVPRDYHAMLVAAVVFGTLASALVVVLSDYARAFAFTPAKLSLAWPRALRLAAQRPAATLALALFELVLGVLTFAPTLLTRPLGIYSLATGALALLALGLRAAGSVVGVAAATDVASRSA
jgi:hypothetical protein